jgi:hypothetical protein
MHGTENLKLYISIVMTMRSYCMFMYGYSYCGFSVLFRQLQGKCQGITRKDRARPALFLIFVLYVLFVLFCVVLFIVCVQMYTVLLPPGGYPIAVKYVISYQNLLFVKFVYLF